MIHIWDTYTHIYVYLLYNSDLLQANSIVSSSWLPLIGDSYRGFFWDELHSWKNGTADTIVRSRPRFGYEVGKGKKKKGGGNGRVGQM